ncbi:MAG TPA: hypothetical protein VNM69_14275 [Bacillus sp. (in: firmicutes)]|nr:hypothetical protein [Bacillus sp. (in: firmicutes)]
MRKNCFIVLLAIFVLALAVVTPVLASTIETGLLMKNLWNSVTETACL